MQKAFLRRVEVVYRGQCKEGWKAGLPGHKMTSKLKMTRVNSSQYIFRRSIEAAHDPKITKPNLNVLAAEASASFQQQLAERTPPARDGRIHMLQAGGYDMHELRILSWLRYLFARVMSFSAPPQQTAKVPPSLTRSSTRLES